MGVTYRAKEKHKEPWQPGRKGTLCTLGLDPDAHAELLRFAAQLVADGAECGPVRYNHFRGRAYAARRRTDGSWYGYPVGFREVPQPIWRRWVAEGALRRAEVQRWWSLEERA